MKKREIAWPSVDERSLPGYPMPPGVSRRDWAATPDAVKVVVYALSTTLIDHSEQDHPFADELETMFAVMSSWLAGWYRRHPSRK